MPCPQMRRSRLDIWIPRDLGNQLLFRDNKPTLEIVDAGRPWSFDGDVPRFASFLKRIGYGLDRREEKRTLRVGRKGLFFSADTPKVRLRQTANGRAKLLLPGNLEMQHAEFPSCLRFSFTRNKLEKSRKPSSSACACLSHDWNRNRGNPCQS